VLTSAVAPTNTLLGNPAAVKKTYETCGANLLRGTRNWVRDVCTNGGMPSTVDRHALQVGRDLALTAGAVVERDEVAELLQYSPTTPTVRKRPLLVVPPPIGRYYFLDLRPGRLLRIEPGDVFDDLRHSLLLGKQLIDVAADVSVGDTRCDTGMGPPPR
jgi:polyhydroxyalkanoate synthase